MGDGHGVLDMNAATAIGTAQRPAVGVNPLGIALDDLTPIACEPAGVPAARTA